MPATKPRPALVLLDELFAVNHKGEIHKASGRKSAPLQKDDVASAIAKELKIPFEGDARDKIMTLVKGWYNATLFYEKKRSSIPRPEPSSFGKAFLSQLMLSPEGIYLRTHPESNEYTSKGNLTLNPTQYDALFRSMISSPVGKALQQRYLTTPHSLLNDYEKIKVGFTYKSRIIPPLREVWSKAWLPIICNQCSSTTPVPITTSPTTPCLRYIDLTKVEAADAAGAPTPTWDLIFSQVSKSYRDVILAWIWSVLETQNRGRQALWLLDGGRGRKTVITNVFLKFFGDAAVATSYTSVDQPWFYYNIAESALAIIPDNKNAKLLMKGKIHSLLGGDTVPVEGKYRDTVNRRLTTKLLVMSNEPPTLNTYKVSDTSRLLCVPIQVKQGLFKAEEKGTDPFEAALMGEMYALLARGRAAYTRLCPNHYNIELTDEIRLEIEGTLETADDGVLESEQELEFERFTTHHLEITGSPDDIVRVQDLYTTFMHSFSNNSQLWSDFINYLQLQHKVRKRRRGNNPREFVGMCIRGRPGGGLIT